MRLILNLILLVAIAGGVIVWRGYSDRSHSVADVGLDETCKNYLYSRNQVAHLSRIGDTAGADQARRAMNASLMELRKNFAETKYADKIRDLEESGYRAGM